MEMKTDYLAVFLALMVGLGTRLVAWYLFNTGVIRGVEHVVKKRALAAAGKHVAVPSIWEIRCAGRTRA